MWHLAVRRSKHNNVRTKIGNITFASRKEGRRYRELLLLEKAGKIKNLQLQVPYVLIDTFTYQGETQRSCKYYADFVYTRTDSGTEITEDAKGYRTDVYKIKKKMLLKRYPDINFIET